MFAHLTSSSFVCVADDNTSKFKFEFCHGVNFEDYESPLHKMSPMHCFLWFKGVNIWQDNRKLFSLNPIIRTIHGKRYGTFEVAPTNDATAVQRNANTLGLFVQSSVATAIELLASKESTSSNVNRPERNFAEFFERTDDRQRRDGQVCVGVLKVKLIVTPFRNKPMNGDRVSIQTTTKIENGLVLLNRHQKECALVNPSISSQLLNFLGNETLKGKISVSDDGGHFYAVCNIFSLPGNVASTNQQMSAIAGRVEYAPRGYGHTISADFSSDKVAELVADVKKRNPMDQLIAQVENERSKAISGSIQYNDPTLQMQSGRTTGRCTLHNGPNHDAWTNNAELADSLIETHNLFDRFMKPKDYDKERFTKKFWGWTATQRTAKQQEYYKKDPTEYKLRIGLIGSKRFVG